MELTRSHWPLQPEANPERDEAELPHLHCDCLHCRNNTRPLLRPLAPRFSSPKEKKMNGSKAYEFVLREMAKGFAGKTRVPDVFFLSDACIIYHSRTLRAPRLKEKQTNIQVRKHFEEQRKRGLGGGVSQLLTPSVLLTPEESSPRAIATRATLKDKEIMIMAYHDGTEQLMSDSLVNKYLSKRKNDPIWEGVSHLQMIPPQIKHPFSKYKHSFVRSTDTVPALNPLVERLSADIDRLEEKNMVSTVPTSRFDRMEDESLEGSYLNPENKSWLSIRHSKSVLQPLGSMFEDLRPEVFQQSSLEVVAYIQVTALVRILQADFQFYSDGSRTYLANIANFVCENLDSQELTIVHDRYKTLEEIGGPQISATKASYDALEAEELLRICRGLVKESLEFRKVELGIKDYRNPSEEALLNIFMRIFPEFRMEKIFGNQNWKNDLQVFVATTRQQINKIIREDEGIRILRRFGIEFRRTFH